MYPGLNNSPTGGSLPGDAGTQPRIPGSYSDTENLSRQSSNRYQPSQERVPLEPLTEFQKFVASTTGKVLPIYGAGLFRRVPSTFAPLDLTPVPSDYLVGPGDELRIRVWGQVTFQADVRVDRSGEVYLPHVGPVHVAGMPFSALDGHLREAIARVYRNFDLTVDVGQIRAIQVYVAGQARRPGVYTVSSLSTLVDALFASGGPSLQGSMRHIQLRRGSTVVTDFDLYNLLSNGDKSKDVQLLSGDVIFIPAVGPMVALNGSVRNPAIYELRGDESLAELIADAGGVSAVAAEARVSIERIEDHHDRRSMEVAYDQAGLATRMADGDLVYVYSIVPAYQKTVILRGNTANPGRFAWHPGMRVSELIPDKDSLITRNYWWRRTQLGLPAPDFEPVNGFGQMRQPADNQPITLKPPPAKSENSPNQPASSQDQYPNPQDQYPNLQNPNPLDSSGTEMSQSANQQGANLQQNGYLQQDGFGLQQGQGGFQVNRSLTADQRGGSGSLAAAQANSATRFSSSPQRTETLLLAPEIDWNFAAIERLQPDNLKTTIIPFDLGKLVLQHDASQDLELQPGDVLSIFSEADIRVPIAQQTKLVKLEGEFVHAGAYTVEPGETLRHLVERAGGFTPDAYLFGSEFSRESTRAIQQARIDEYVRSVDMEMQRGRMALAAAGMTSPQDPTSATAAQASERELLASLHRIRATGRIVLAFKSDSSGTAGLPDIAMEDGDRFVVPSQPANINVVGAVYDQNSFLYHPDRHVKTYLQMAGGPNRNADARHAFVIRADGEVISRSSQGGPWGDEFSKLRMNPGDTIVVPDKTIKPSTLRSVLDWSQMFSQFALGAAALSYLHP